MRNILYLLSIWLLLSCDRKTDPQPSFQGTYVGVFQRDKGKASEVELTFTGDRYTGKVIGLSGGSVYDSAFPVICKGQFVVSQGTIDFQDECVYTANFDWSLILSREWTIRVDNNVVTLSRNKDSYKLTKQ